MIYKDRIKNIMKIQSNFIYFLLIIAIFIIVFREVSSYSKLSFLNLVKYSDAGTIDLKQINGTAFSVEILVRIFFNFI